MAQCLFPFYIEPKIYHNQEAGKVPVPCGKCPNCLKRRVQSWLFRLQQEAKVHDKQFFVTLTYDNEHVPRSSNNFLTLDKTHVQKFFKRLRKATNSKIRYYMCGEYGSKYRRPHYHLILFGDNRLTELSITNAWHDPDTRSSYGNVYFGTVKEESITYTVQYYDKGDWRPDHKNDDRQPEFSLMSKGLGSNFITEQTVRFINSRPDQQYLYTQGGIKIAIPSYYRRRLYDYLPTNEDTIKAHPSILGDYAERQIEKKKRQSIIKQIQYVKETNTPEPTAAERRSNYEDRKAAITNYKQSKRKTRDTL